MNLSIKIDILEPGDQYLRVLRGYGGLRFVAGSLIYDIVYYSARKKYI